MGTIVVVKNLIEINLNMTETIKVNMEDFKKWALGNFIVAETDMEHDMKMEAIDAITGAIEKS